MSMILIFMILLHIIDDFVLQPVSLSKLKQKSWWENNETGKDSMYRNDYKVALTIHGISWAIMITLPMIVVQLIYSMPTYVDVFIWYSVILNALLHALIDDAKANGRTINLLQDQLCHLGQIVVTFTLWCLLMQM